MSPNLRLAILLVGLVLARHGGYLAWEGERGEEDDDDDDEKADDDAAVQEELPLGDNSDDEPETPSTFNEDAYDTMRAAYNKLEERKEEFERCLESVLESISALLEDTETFRRGLDSNGLDQT